MTNNDLNLFKEFLSKIVDNILDDDIAYGKKLYVKITNPINCNQYILSNLQNDLNNYMISMDMKYSIANTIYINIKYSNVLLCNSASTNNMYNLNNLKEQINVLLILKKIKNKYDKLGDIKDIKELHEIFKNEINKRFI